MSMVRRRPRSLVRRGGTHAIAQIGARAVNYAIREGIKSVARTMSSSVSRSGSTRPSTISSPPGRKKRKYSRAFSTPRVVRMRYQTRGYFGRFGRKLRKQKYNKFNKGGTTTFIEKGGVSSGDDVVYLGHGSNGNKIFQEVCRAITKKLFVKAGYRVISMSDKIQDDASTAIVVPGRIVITYKGSETNGLELRAFDVTADSNFGEVASQVHGNFNNILSASPSTRDNISYEDISYYVYDGAGVLCRTPAAKIVLQAMRIGVRCYSRMEIQNRTAAGAAAGTDQTNMLDIANNPVDGRVYFGRGSGALLKFSDNSSSIASTGSFLADPTSSVIECVPTLAGGWTPEMKNTYKRPPSSYAFTHVTKSARCSLSPGQIKTSKLFWRKMMSFQQFMHLNWYAHYGYTQSTNPRVTMGSFKFYGFSKRCNTTVDEPSISIGYEVNTQISAVCIETPSVTIRDTLVL